MEIDPMTADVDEAEELRAFNDPFEGVADLGTHRRHAEVDAPTLPKLSAQDEAKILSLMDGTHPETALINDACAKMISMQIIRPDILLELQDNYDFDKVRASPGLQRLKSCLGRPWYSGC